MIDATEKLSPSDRVRVSGRYELGIGEVLRLSETGGLYVADVVFESRSGRRLETLPSSTTWKRPLRLGTNSAQVNSIIRRTSCFASLHGSSRWEIPAAS